ncbi:MAG: hypothetical protein Q8Q63_14725 [Phaeovulum sp.]|uniref:hypothetical protein n=1 Tax=Phaeovulum sp. TaxID=2934796 RepID=UPI002734A487|nr:hypothetical protein [Phaeovulum sp.]MDP3862828.1 hypothetical protein [Phaeovulum sp.]
MFHHLDDIAGGGAHQHPHMTRMRSHDMAGTAPPSPLPPSVMMRGGQEAAAAEGLLAVLANAGSVLGGGLNAMGGPGFGGGGALGQGPGAGGGGGGGGSGFEVSDWAAQQAARDAVHKRVLVLNERAQLLRNLRERPVAVRIAGVPLSFGVFAAGASGVLVLSLPLLKFMLEDV